MTASRGWSGSMQAMPVAEGHAAEDLTGTRAVRAWPWALSTAAALGLLLALGWVVQSAVHQAARRHADMTAQTEALWRCNSVSGRDARATCRREAGTITAADRR